MADLLRNKAYINGEWRAAEHTFAVQDPANGELLAEVADLELDAVDEAITAARRAFIQWRAKTAKEREDLLKNWAALILEQEKVLAQIITREQGKPLAEACTEIRYGERFIQWFAEEGKRAYGDIVPPFERGKRVLVLKEPIGVVAAITPWNFPVAMITRKVAPALAAGCTVIVKPASKTPLSALALAELAERAGIPPGVFNIVTSTKSEAVGRALCSSTQVNKLSFTGSTHTGSELLRYCAPAIKKTSMELGGNAPFIVFADAPLEQAVTGAVQSKFRNMGQTCVCANRFFVEASIYEPFVRALAARVQKLVVGAGLEEGVEQGPLIDERAVRKVEDLLEDALAKGARLVTGGKRHALGGTFFEPTVVSGVRADMRCMQEEIFGPVACVSAFQQESEVIELANNTPYGLAAYVYSQDIGRALRLGEALACGIVALNAGGFSTETAPFGGYKASGFGREGSKYGLDEYLQTKYVLLGGVD